MYGFAVFSFSLKATIEFDDDLYRQLKATAALRGRKLRELVEDGVRAVLQAPPASRSVAPRAKFPLVKAARKKALSIPADIASRIEIAEDIERYAASLRQ